MQRAHIPVILLLMSCAMPALADEKFTPPECTPLGTVLIATPPRGLDRHARNYLDTLMPKIRKMGKDRLIWIEGNDSTGTATENKLTNSFDLAKNVQQYLTSRNNFNHEIYLSAASDAHSPRKAGTVRIFVCPKQFNEDTIELSRNLTDNKSDGTPSGSDR